LTPSLSDVIGPGQGSFCLPMGRDEDGHCPAADFERVRDPRLEVPSYRRILYVEAHLFWSRTSPFRVRLSFPPFRAVCVPHSPFRVGLGLNHLGDFSLPPLCFLSLFDPHPLWPGTVFRFFLIHTKNLPDIILVEGNKVGIAAPPGFLTGGVFGKNPHLSQPDRIIISNTTDDALIPFSLTDSTP